jgi:4'-phosphopantetheinyl transferase
MGGVVIGRSLPASRTPHSTVSRDHIGVWLFRTSTTAAQVDGDHVLSDDERRRADSYVRDEDRTRFIVGRAGVRMVLASYVGVDARSLTFAARPNGKPILTAPPSATNLQFSVSHSGGLVVCAVGYEREIGIDVEYDPRLRALADDAHVLLSAVEERTLKAVVGPEREQRLSEYWTLKEAFLKATGEGLRSDLRCLTFEIGPDLSCRCTTIGRADAQDWEFRLLRPVPQYTIAVCAERGASPLRPEVREFIPTKPRKKSTV